RLKPCLCVRESRPYRRNSVSLSERSSNATGRKLDVANALQVWLPMKPAPPVTRMVSVMGDNERLCLSRVTLKQGRQQMAPSRECLPAAKISLEHCSRTASHFGYTRRIVGQKQQLFG